MRAVTNSLISVSVTPRRVYSFLSTTPDALCTSTPVSSANKAGFAVVYRR